MRITSLTGFSSKLARVYVMKVSFLLENRNGRGVQARRGLTGAGAGELPSPRTGGPRLGQQPWAPAPFTPNVGSREDPACVWGPGPHALLSRGAHLALDPGRRWESD